MRNSLIFLSLAALLVFYSLRYQADAAPAGPLIKHLSSLLKWTRPVSRSPQSDGDVLQFENGYLVETVVEGNEIGVIPYKIRVSDDGELFAVDEVNSNIVKITPPLSQYSRARLVAGSFQGYSGHVDGKPSEARFNHPRGVTMDDKGNVYVADTLNLAIRKIGDSGVTTIAGGKSNVAGYRDGPSEDAQFSSDFDVIYVRPTCSLLVVDRGNAALRQISLDQEDCDYQYSSISSTDVLMVIGAVLVGYSACMLHQGYGPFSFLRRKRKSKRPKDFPEPTKPLSPSVEVKEQSPQEEKQIPVVENVKNEEPGWPSFGQLILDLSKLAVEALGGVLLYFVPSRLKPNGSRTGLEPLKDTLRMPEDEPEPEQTRKQRAPVPLSETRQAHPPPPTVDHKIHNQSEPAAKAVKFKSTSFRDPSVKHRKQQEYAEFYGLGELPPPPYAKSKSHKERTRHRQREKSAEAVEQKQSGEMKGADYENHPKFEHYNIRGKYGSSDSFRF
ncbi:uncharacterized protein LOC116192882 isoform X2 [Punica granatum]|uniref:Uncharacterized protein LOC116192882 isoform X2 n=1 Tax=Punica granatum TaxID=22663 RepID=A0A6P8C1P2_PUNGR|nr:uncharacterized protein LOC116192882 isoform X2 [Punica granatum]